MAFGVKRPNTSARVRVPGGVTIGPTVTSTQPTAFGTSMSILGQLSSVFAPIQPMIALIRFGQAVFATFEALGDVIAVPPNLDALTEAIEELADAGSAILALQPTSAVLFFVTDIVNLLRVFVDGLDEQLAQIDAVLAQETALREAADQDFVPAAAKTSMEADADCLAEVADTLATSLSDVLEPVDVFLVAVNLLASLIPNATPIPEIGAFEGVEDARAAVQAFREALDAISF